ncbi:MAG: hypothetical protein JWO93_3249 [Micrococcaceae bacterium]|nr:hypothetical protein [Micrococcaceae bacterium]
MINSDSIHNLINAGGTVRTTGGETIGPIGNIYVDDTTGEPDWVAVRRATSGNVLIPLHGATIAGRDIVVPYESHVISTAPATVGAGEHLSQANKDELRRHYAARSGQSDAGSSDDVEGSGMVRSEERLRVGTQWTATERVRLRKRIVTEMVTITQTVPVRREVLDIDREPVTDSTDVGSALPGDLPEGLEIILREERPVVRMESVAIERVRVHKDTVQAQASFTDQLRKERIEVGGDITGGDTAGGGITGGDTANGDNFRSDRGV